MDIELRAQVYSLELLTTQLISEYLRTVPEPEKQMSWARDHLQRVAQTMPVDSEGFDEEARLRLSIKDHIARCSQTHSDGDEDIEDIGCTARKGTDR